MNIVEDIKNSIKIIEDISLSKNNNERVATRKIPELKEYQKRMIEATKKGVFSVDNYSDSSST